MKENVAYISVIYKRTMALNINRVLANELLEMVLSWLPPKDRMSAILVCRSWWNLISNPKFWTWVSFDVDHRNIDLMPTVIEFERLKAVRKISLCCYAEVDYTGTNIWQIILNLFEKSKKT